MTNKATKYGLMTIAAVMLVALAFAGAVSADYTLQGAGTETHPYQINTALDLYNISQNTTYFQTAGSTTYFKLMNDICISDIGSVVTDNEAKTVTINSNANGSMVYNWGANSFSQSSWNPVFNETVASLAISSWPCIGTVSNPVTGNINFNGNGKTISGLFINDSASIGYQALFGYISNNAVVTITHLTIENSFVYSSSSQVGGVIGQIIGNTVVRVDNSSMNNGSVIGEGVVGGLVGKIVNDATGSPDVTLENSKTVRCSLITISANNAGGLVSCAWHTPLVKTVNCKVMDCTISSATKMGASGLIARPLNVTIIASDCDVSNCNISTSTSDASGLFGYTDSKSVITASNCTVTHCSIKAPGFYAGGLISRLATSGTTFYVSNCSVMYCNISQSGSGNNGVGGLIGILKDVGTFASIEKCNVLNCNISNLAGTSSGGIVGHTHSAVTIKTCKVSDCEISALGNGAGGVIGGASDNGILIIDYCDVVNCEKISGKYNSAGLVGWIGSSKQIIANNSTVKNSCIISTSGDLGSSFTLGGLLGTLNTNESSCLHNNTLENVEINVTAGDAQYAYLFDVTLYPINSTNGIAKLAQINLANDNKIINSYVLNSSGSENSKLDGFANLVTEFAITVSNPSITVIDEDAFKDSKLTGLSNISSTITICANAFNGSKLNGGFYIPLTATLDPYAFNGMESLQIIYGNTFDGLTGLNESIALVNITDIGTLSAIQPGSFSVSSGNKFETVKLGSNTANKFKNLSDGTYLTANGPWTPGYSYLAEYEYVPPAYTPSSSKQTGSTVILSEGQVAPTAYATVTPTVAPTAKPTEKPATPTVIATAKPTTQSTQASPAPFLGILAGLGAAAVLLRLRK